jgi:hypothetical protein
MNISRSEHAHSVKMLFKYPSRAVRGKRVYSEGTRE